MTSAKKRPASPIVHGIGVEFAELHGCEQSVHVEDMVQNESDFIEWWSVFSHPYIVCPNSYRWVTNKRSFRSSRQQHGHMPYR